MAEVGRVGGGDRPYNRFRLGGLIFWTNLLLQLVDYYYDRFLYCYLPLLTTEATTATTTTTTTTAATYYHYHYHYYYHYYNYYYYCYYY